MIAKVVRAPSACSQEVFRPAHSSSFIWAPAASHTGPLLPATTQFATHPLVLMVTQFSKRTWSVINSTLVGGEAGLCNGTEHAFPAF